MQVHAAVHIPLRLLDNAEGACCRAWQPRGCSRSQHAEQRAQRCSRTSSSGCCRCRRRGTEWHPSRQTPGHYHPQTIVTMIGRALAACGYAWLLSVCLCLPSASAARVGCLHFGLDERLMRSHEWQAVSATSCCYTAVLVPLCCCVWQPTSSPYSLHIPYTKLLKAPVFANMVPGC